jgi:phenylpyruvate tautomerase PptA (4-oxalocrotonate tautomerase family)
MPITVTAPEGELTDDGKRQILPRLTAALLEASEAAGNPFFTSIIGGTLHVIPRQDVYAGGTNRPVVMVELKLPDIGLADLGERAAFIEAATDIVDELTVHGHDRWDTWVNILNAPPGAWGIGGKAWTGEDLVAAATASVATLEAAG